MSALSIDSYADAVLRDHGLVGLIYHRRRMRIRCEVARLSARLAELHEDDPERYYEGDWQEVCDGLLLWRTRDPYDEEHW